MGSICVLLVGHSYISHLRSWIGQQNWQFDFNLQQCNVRYFGLSGGTVGTLYHNAAFWRCIYNFRPNVIVCQIGGNDICFPDLRPESIACEIADFTHELALLDFVQVVVICELFTRPKPRYITPDAYEEKRRTINNMLPVLLEDIHAHKTFFWLHLRLMNSPLPIFHQDMVHLSHVGQKKLYRSLRLAILHAIDR